MNDLREENLRNIAERFADEIEFFKSDVSTKKQYPQIFKAYVIQHALDFGDYSKLSKVTGIKKDTIKKWAYRSRVSSKEKSNKEFIQLKITYKTPIEYYDISTRP